jgi:hypothetical protein
MHVCLSTAVEHTPQEMRELSGKRFILRENRLLLFHQSAIKSTPSFHPHSPVLASLFVCLTTFLASDSLILFHHGAHVCFGRLPKNHFKRGKAWTTTGSNPTFLQGCHQVFTKDARTWYVVSTLLIVRSFILLAYVARLIVEETDKMFYCTMLAHRIL